MNNLNKYSAKAGLLQNLLFAYYADFHYPMLMFLTLISRPASLILSGIADEFDAWLGLTGQQCEHLHIPPSTVLHNMTMALVFFYHIGVVLTYYCLTSLFLPAAQRHGHRVGRIGGWGPFGPCSFISEYGKPQNSIQKL